MGEIRIRPLGAPSTMDATAAAADIREGKTAYAAGKKLTGTLRVGQHYGNGPGQISTFQLFMTGFQPDRGGM